MKRKPRSQRQQVLALLKLSPSIVVAFFLGYGACLFLASSSWQGTSTENPQIQACFSPEGHCEDRIVSLIQGARQSILVQAYSFTSPEIGRALIEAHRRGVTVKVLIDKGQIKDKHSQFRRLKAAGVPLYIDSPPGLAHNKVMVFDDKLVLTGSFNFTRSANTRNAENVLLIEDVSLAEIYTQNWNMRARKARAIRP